MIIPKLIVIVYYFKFQNYRVSLQKNQKRTPITIRTPLLN